MGKFSTAMSTFLILPAIVILMAFFVFESYWIAHPATNDNFVSIPITSLLRSSVLFKSVNTSTGDLTIAEELIRGHQLNGYHKDFITGLENFVRNDSNFINKKSCLYLGVGDVVHVAGQTGYQTTSEIFVDKDQNGEVSSSQNEGSEMFASWYYASRTDINPSIADKISKLELNLTGKIVWINSYYGVCT